jgi:predicted methyltransferase
MMKRYLILGAAVAALATAALAQEAMQPPGLMSGEIAAALADERRPAEERERDAGRRAAEVLALTGVEPGDHVADLVVGGGYFTRLFAAIVGPEGHVHAWQPGEFVAFQASYGEQLEAVDAAYENVSGQTSAFAELDLPEGTLDLAFTAQNYHDFHLRPFPETTAGSVNAEIFRALEPCGRYFVIDHHATAGSGFTDSHTLHRAEEAAVTTEIEAAGFALIGTSDLLENADDPLTANVFDEGIRGRTSQFVLVFQKPGPGCAAA